jgi:hypothetical protein
MTALKIVNDNVFVDEKLDSEISKDDERPPDVLITMPNTLKKRLY